MKVNQFLHLDMVQAYLSGVPDTYLDQPLDWDNNVERDLKDIVECMLEWEEKLTSHFNLTPANIHDIKATNASPILGR